MSKRDFYSLFFWLFIVIASTAEIAHICIYDFFKYDVFSVTYWAIGLKLNLVKIT